MVKISARDANAFVRASYDPTPQKDIDGYKLDTELSTRKAKVYHNPQNGQTVVANRGTTGTVADWANNLRYAVGDYNNTGRMKQAEKVQDKAIEKYGKVDTNIGHSQSGIITRNLNAKGKTGQVININPAITMEKQKKNEYNVRSNLDVVSSLAAINPFMKSKNNKTIKAESWNPLTEHSSNILDRINPAHMFGGKLRTNELSNVDLFELLKHYKIPFNGCVIASQISKLLKNGFTIINLNGQSHWTALLKDGKKYYYFDSYGFVPPQPLEDIIGEYIYSENDIQSMASSSCGWYCIAWMKYLYKKKNKELAYAKFLSLFTTNKNENEKILHSML